MVRNLHKWVRRHARNGKQNDEAKPAPSRDIPLAADLQRNTEILQSLYANCSDVIFRPFRIADTIDAMIIYIEGLTNIEELGSCVLTPLMNGSGAVLQDARRWVSGSISVSKVSEANTIGDCIESVSRGEPVLLHEGDNRGLVLGLGKWEKRPVDEPTAEVVVRGPREGFTESIGVNISQLRRIIKSPALKVEAMKIGDYTRTKVAISYVEGIADQTLVDEVKSRLSRIKIDGILESGYIEEMIEDYSFSPFPQILSTERPDVTCANLLEGRVAILVEGTPFTLVAPTTFFSLMQSAEDYYQRFLIATAIRWLRYLFLGISLLLPSLYVAILTFHQEMVPTALLLSMAAAREAVPFPALVEVLLMEVTFEALREAGVRLPKQIGAAVSIVGALVVGQAAVQAGLVSAPMVIVVAITGISSFMIPRYVTGIAIRMLRFPIIFLAGSLGLLGVMIGIIAIVVHMCTLRSFGVPFLSPLAPTKGNELKDVAVRAPLWMMDRRPHLTGEDNSSRQAPNQKPDPSNGGES
ncbi:spore germination protein [Paenibacillus mesophilus]|uniref:spore germination protein n=1 Tax=Paenibacillus mesophilus TaxID=2582849 RepID=UPI00110DD901|nr:spore germination protein [Paenibacillus mesophilus]TMV48914.1 spore germination protein [Paenibacillus mesophilus]